MQLGEGWNEPRQVKDVLPAGEGSVQNQVLNLWERGGPGLDDPLKQKSKVKGQSTYSTRTRSQKEFITLHI